MNRKIAFFDIDGTLTSEIDGIVPISAKHAIQKARENGHLMFINTGRCMQNVEDRFREVGFDGYVCGCGTNIYCTEHNELKEILYQKQSHEVVHQILSHARNFKLDLLFESKHEVRFDTKRDFFTSGGLRQYNAFRSRNYDMSHDPESEDFTCDKFVVWFDNINDLPAFRNVSDLYFDCIDRGGNFREFIPYGYSKATGIQKVLEFYNLPHENTYAFGDSNNDLSMLSFVATSIAMGNSEPQSLFSHVNYVTTKASEHGIANALEYFQFI